MLVHQRVCQTLKPRTSMFFPKAWSLTVPGPTDEKQSVLRIPSTCLPCSSLGRLSEVQLFRPPSWAHWNARCQIHFLKPKKQESSRGLIYWLHFEWSLAQTCSTFLIHSIHWLSTCWWYAQPGGLEICQLPFMGPLQHQGTLGTARRCPAKPLRESAQRIQALIHWSTAWWMGSTYQQIQWSEASSSSWDRPMACADWPPMDNSMLRRLHDGASTLIIVFVLASRVVGSVSIGQRSVKIGSLQFSSSLASSRHNDGHPAVQRPKVSSSVMEQPGPLSSSHTWSQFAAWHFPAELHSWKMIWEWWYDMWYVICDRCFMICYLWYMMYCMILYMIFDIWYMIRVTWYMMHFI